MLCRDRQRSLIAFRDFPIISILVETVRPSLGFSGDMEKNIYACVGLSGVSC